jgi:hypothetical protein
MYNRGRVLHITHREVLRKCFGKLVRSKQASHNSSGLDWVVGEEEQEPDRPHSTGRTDRAPSAGLLGCACAPQVGHRKLAIINNTRQLKIGPSATGGWRGVCLSVVTSLSQEAVPSRESLFLH